VRNVVLYLLPKVIRILRQLVGLPGGYGTIREFRGVFLKKLSFSDIKDIFLEFLPLKIDNAEAHARGFASL